MQLRDKTLWLIGASSGIGASLAPRLGREGVRLAISSRDEDGLQKVAKRAGGAAVTVKPLDVTEKGAVERVASELSAEWGRIDILLYNAGTWSSVDVQHFDAESFEKQIAVNYTGLVRAVGAVLPQMVARGSGEIIGVGSLSAYGGLPRAEAYGSTKSAVNYLLQSLRMDLREHGVGVTTVNPGFVKTALTDRNDFPMPFIMQPGDAADTIVRGLLAGRSEIHFPKRLSVPLKAFTALPRPLYEWVAGRTLKRG